MHAYIHTLSLIIYETESFQNKAKNTTISDKNPRKRTDCHMDMKNTKMHDKITTYLQ